MTSDPWGFDDPPAAVDEDLVLGTFVQTIGPYRTGSTMVFSRSELEVFTTRGLARQTGDARDAARHLRNRGPFSRFRDGSDR